MNAADLPSSANASLSAKGLSRIRDPENDFTSTVGPRLYSCAVTVAEFLASSRRAVLTRQLPRFWSTLTIHATFSAKFFLWGADSGLRSTRRADKQC
jgi:hypothetical protein